jgi:hypothetical protein
MLRFEPERAQKLEPQHLGNGPGERINGYFVSVEARVRDRFSQDKR